MQRGLAVMALLLLSALLMLPVQAQEPVGEESVTEANTPENQPIRDYSELIAEGQAQPGQLPGQRSLTGSLVKMAASLMVVVGLIILLAWMSKKFLPARLMGEVGKGNSLKLIQSLPLGPRRYVSLVEADGRRFLLGVTEQQINLIKALDELPFDGALSQAEAPLTVKELMEAEQ